MSLPLTGNRYMSMQVEDHFTEVYGAGSYIFSREKAYTRYILALVRTLVDPTNPKDIQEVHALQDAIKASQSNPGRFEVPNWDQTSRKKIHDAALDAWAAQSWRWPRGGYPGIRPAVADICADDVVIRLQG
jgi:hypothetical protein